MSRRSSAPTVEDLADLKHALRTRSQAHFEGELLDVPAEGRPVKIAVPIRHRGRETFWTIKAFPDQVKIASQSLLTQPEKQRHRLCRLTAHVDVDADGFVLRNTEIRVLTACGPLSEWRKNQARLGDVSHDARPRHQGPDDALRLLRGAGQGDIVWLGSATSQAFSDAVDPDRAPRLICAGVPMHGPRASEEIAAALNALPDTTHAVLISRGGGATTDLTPFDDARVLTAAKSAKARGIRIICAIGHRRDQPLLEQIAHCALRTPTALGSALHKWVTNAPTAAEAEAQRKAFESQLRAQIHNAQDKANQLQQSLWQAERQVARANAMYQNTQNALDAVRNQQWETYRRHAEQRLRSRARASWPLWLAITVLTSILLWPHPLACGIAAAPLAVVTLLTALTPQRLGRRARRRIGRFDPLHEFEAARRVRDYNSLVAPK